MALVQPPLSDIIKHVDEATKVMGSEKYERARQSRKYYSSVVIADTLRRCCVALDGAAYVLPEIANPALKELEGFPELADTVYINGEKQVVLMRIEARQAWENILYALVLIRAQCVLLTRDEMANSAHSPFPSQEDPRLDQDGRTPSES